MNNLITAMFSYTSDADMVFTIIATIGSILFLSGTLLTLFGHDLGHDTDGDGVPDHGGEAGAGFKIWTLRSVTTFLMFFGFVGKLCLQHHSSILSASLASLMCGTAGMFLMAFIFRSIMRLEDGGAVLEVDCKSLVGKTCVVYNSCDPLLPGMVTINVGGVSKQVRASSRWFIPSGVSAVVAGVDDVTGDIVVDDGRGLLGARVIQSVTI